MTPPPHSLGSPDGSAVASLAAALRRFTSDADDLAQEAWVVSQSSPAPAGVPKASWLSGIAKRLAISTQRANLRRAQREVRSARSESHVEGLASAGETAAWVEAAAMVSKAVDRLPSPQATVIRMKYWEELPPREIASRLGIDVEAVKSRHRRAIAALRSDLDESVGDRWHAAVPLVATAGYSKAPLIWAVAAIVAVGGLRVGSHVLRTKPAEVSVTARGSEPSVRPPKVLEPPTQPASRESLDVAADPSASSAIRIRGRVVDDDGTIAGRPAVDVLVSAFPVDMELDPNEGPAVRTDLAGRFELTVPIDRSRHHSVHLSAEGNAERSRVTGTIVVEHSISGPGTEVLLRRYRIGDLFGVVVDDRGAPLAGVEVTATDTKNASAVRITDADGRFYFAAPDARSQLSAELDGWRQVRPFTAVGHSDGRWDEARLTMVRRGELHVRIEGPDGAPLPGVPVRVELVQSEGAAAQMPRQYRGHGDEIDVTDADGTATFASIWAGVGLRVSDAASGKPSSFERAHEGVLVDEPDGDLVVVPAGETATFTIRVRHAYQIRGRVVDEDGNGRPSIDVCLRAMAQTEHAKLAIEAFATSGSDGRFLLSFATRGELERASLSANTLSPLGLLRTNDPTPLFAQRSLDLANLPQEEVVLALAAAREVRGIVVDEDGNGVAAGIELTSDEWNLHGNHLPSGASRFGASFEDEGFRIAGLPEGGFRITAKPEEFAHKSVEVMELGSSEIRIELDRPLSASVRVNVESGAGELAQAWGLIGRVRPHDSATIAAPGLAHASRCLSLGEWPATLAWPAAGWTTTGGRDYGIEWRLRPIETSGEELRLAPGHYVLGAWARGRDGELLARASTGVVYVRPGSFRMTFRLGAMGTLRGRAPKGTRGLYVALMDETGTLLPIPARHDSLATATPVGANGQFDLGRVPIGRWAVLIGTHRQLHGGDAPYAKTVDLRLSPDAFVEF